MKTNHIVSWYHVCIEFEDGGSMSKPFNNDALKAFKFLKSLKHDRSLGDIKLATLEKHRVNNAVVSSVRDRLVGNPSLTWEYNDVLTTTLYTFEGEY